MAAKFKRDPECVPKHFSEMVETGRPHWAAAADQQPAHFFCYNYMRAAQTPRWMHLAVEISHILAQPCFGTFLF